MQNELIALTNALNVPLLSEDDIAALNRLQKQWEHWALRERQHAALRVAAEQQATFNAFVENPTATSHVFVTDFHLMSPLSPLSQPFSRQRERLSALSCEKSRFPFQQ